MTNGEMMMATFPNFKFHLVKVYDHQFMEGGDNNYEYNDLRFDLAWWTEIYDPEEEE